MLSAIRRGFVSCFVIAGAAVALVLGANVARFELQLLALEPARRGDAPVEQLGFWRRPPDVKPLVTDWASRPGTASQARRIMAEEPDAPAQTAQRLLDVSRALEIMPTSGRLWLGYADLLFGMGFPPERMWAAIEMAQLTDRREPESMLVASLQVVRLWESASARQRDKALGDLASYRWLARGERLMGLKAVLAAKPPEVRAEIAAGLASRLGRDQGFLKQVGL